MADYFPLISRAVSGLDPNTAERRQAIYARATEALDRQLTNLDPPIAPDDLARERAALASAIQRLEAEYTAAPAPQPAAVPPPSPPSPRPVEPVVPAPVAPPKPVAAPPPPPPASPPVPRPAEPTLQPPIARPQPPGLPPLPNLPQAPVPRPAEPTLQPPIARPQPPVLPPLPNLPQAPVPRPAEPTLQPPITRPQPPGLPPLPNLPQAPVPRPAEPKLQPPIHRPQPPGLPPLPQASVPRPAEPTLQPPIVRPQPPVAPPLPQASVPRPVEPTLQPPIARPQPPVMPPQPQATAPRPMEPVAGPKPLPPLPTPAALRPAPVANETVLSPSITSASIPRPHPPVPAAPQPPAPPPPPQPPAPKPAEDGVMHVPAGGTHIIIDPTENESITDVPLRPKVSSEASRGFAGRKGLILAIAIGVPAFLGIGALAYILRDDPSLFRPQEKEQTSSDTAGGAQRKASGRLDGSGSAPASGPRRPPQEAQPLPVATRVIYFEETPDDARGKQSEGQVVWRLETLPGSTGAPPVTAVRGSVTIPDAKMSMEMVVRVNRESTLPASHTVDVTFKPQGDRAGVLEIGPIEARDQETQAGYQLKGAMVPVGENLFLVGLDKTEQALAKNIEAMRDRRWFAFQFRLKDNRIGAILIEKGPTGDRTFKDAIASWGQ